MRHIRALEKVTLTALIFAGFTGNSAKNALAQGTLDTPPPEKKIGVGADLQLVLPFGTLGETSGPLLGPMLRAGYRVVPRVELTGRVGYLFGFGKDRGGGKTTSLTLIPIWLGARYFALDPNSGLYGAGEVAVNLSQLHFDPDPGDIDAKSLRARVGFNLGVGYVVSARLPIDFRLQFMYLNLLGTEAGDKAFVGLGLGAGYTLSF